MSQLTTNGIVTRAIRLQRIRAGIASEAELARLAGMSPAGLSRRLSGDQRLTLTDVQLLAQALDVSPFDLMSSEGSPHRSRDTAPQASPSEVARRLVVEVREAAQAAGISLRHLAERTGIPAATLSRRLAGDGKGFKLSELILVADVVGVPVDELAARAEGCGRSMRPTGDGRPIAGAPRHTGDTSGVSPANGAETMHEADVLAYRAALAAEMRAVAARERLGLDALSEATGIGRAALRRKMAGRSPVFVDELVRFAVATGTDPGTLIAAASAV